MHSITHLFKDMVLQMEGYTTYMIEE